jgi:sugar phosphate isomerase/epimerase
VPRLHSRRSFITTCAAVSSAWAVSARPTGSEPTTTRGGSTGTFGSRIHVFAKPFHAYSYEETADLLAQAGYQGIDFTVRPGGHVEPDRVREDLPRAVAAARAAGLRVDMITTAITRADAGARTLLATAADLGISVYRLGNFRYEPEGDPWQKLREIQPHLLELARLNEHLGIHGGFQNHSGTWRVGAAGWDLHELLRDHDPRWLGCQFDIRHATAVLGTSWPVVFAVLAPWIRSIDIKDFRWIQRPGSQEVEDVPLGEGIVDLSGFLGRLHASGIDAAWSLHLEYPPFEHASLPHGPELRAMHLDGLRRERDRLAALVSSATRPS